MQDKELSPGLTQVTTGIWYVIAALFFGLVAVDQFAKPLFTGAAVWFVLGFAFIALLIATLAPPWVRAFLLGKM